MFKVGLPFITSVVYIYIVSADIDFYSNAGEVIVYSFVLPLILISLLYIITVCTVLFNSNAGDTSTSKWRRLCIATLLFVLSNTLMFYPDVFGNFIPATTFNLYEIISRIIEPLSTYIYFVLVKRNRVLWYEFYVNILNERKKKKEEDIEMNNKNVSPTTDQPAVNNTEEC